MTARRSRPGLSGAIEDVATAAVALAVGLLRIAACLALLAVAMTIGIIFALIAGANHASRAAARPRTQRTPSLD